MSGDWSTGSTREWRRLRLAILDRDGWTCRLCGLAIDPRLTDPHPMSAQVHHTLGKAHGDDPRHLQAAHRICNQRVGDPSRKVHSPDDRTPAVPVRSLSLTLRNQLEIRAELSWRPDVMRRYPWLAELGDVPEDAAPPLAMSPVPGDAVGSYGWEAAAWIEQTQGIRLRWWQVLASVRQLEHRADGSLCHRSVVESTPRRAGKSLRIRGMCLWRLDQADLFGEPQTIIHTGSDVAICREIQRGAWRWCEANDWGVSRSNGKEAIETPSGDRWLVRAQRAVYGYDVCFGIVDEGWDVSTDTITEGLEPAMLERSSPQLHLTSTSHRRATSLMRTSLLHALDVDDPTVLLLLWGARPGDDPADEAVWRAASPHWSEDRRAMIAAKYEKALSGEDDPELDDPDPLRGFEAQYLNVWRLKEHRDVGDPVVSPEAWGDLTVAPPEGPPAAVAVEDWFGEGVSVACAWRDGPRAVVSVSVHPDLEVAAQRVRGTGYTGRVVVGASIAADPAWQRVRTDPQTRSVRAAVEDLGRLVAEGLIAHDGSPELTAEVLALRTSPGVDGPRVRSTTPAGAVKAAVWAALTCRETPVRSPVVVL